MRAKRVPISRNPTETSLPTIQETNRGELRVLSGDGVTTTDKLMFGRNRAGTTEWIDVVMSNDVPNLTIQNADVTVGGDASVIDFSDDFTVTESPTNELNIDLTAAMTFTIGPFFKNDVPGTATSDLFLPFYDTLTASSIGTSGSHFMPLAGRVIGAFITSDAARSAGTATLRPTISGTGQNISGGNPVLDATNTTRHGVAVKWANGVSFNAGQRVGCELVSSGWTPITANVTAFLVVAMNP